MGRYRRAEIAIDFVKLWVCWRTQRLCDGAAREVQNQTISWLDDLQERFGDDLKARTVLASWIYSLPHEVAWFRETQDLQGSTGSDAVDRMYSIADIVTPPVIAAFMVVLAFTVSTWVGITTALGACALVGAWAAHIVARFRRALATMLEDAPFEAEPQ